MLRKLLSLSRHSGHDRTSCWLDPVANDPKAEVNMQMPRSLRPTIYRFVK